MSRFIFPLEARVKVTKPSYYQGKTGTVVGHTLHTPPLIIVRFDGEMYGQEGDGTCINRQDLEIVKENNDT